MEVETEFEVKIEDGGDEPVILARDRRPPEGRVRTEGRAAPSEDLPEGDLERLLG